MDYLPVQSTATRNNDLHQYTIEELMAVINDKQKKRSTKSTVSTKSSTTSATSTKSQPIKSVYPVLPPKEKTLNIEVIQDDDDDVPALELDNDEEEFILPEVVPRQSINTSNPAIQSSTTSTAPTQSSTTSNDILLSKWDRFRYSPALGQSVPLSKQFNNQVRSGNKALEPHSFPAQPLHSQNPLHPLRPLRPSAPVDEYNGQSDEDEAPLLQPQRAQIPQSVQQRTAPAQNVQPLTIVNEYKSAKGKEVQANLVLCRDTKTHKEYLIVTRGSTLATCTKHMKEKYTDLYKRREQDISSGKLVPHGPQGSAFRATEDLYFEVRHDRKLKTSTPLEAMQRDLAIFVYGGIPSNWGRDYWTNK